MSTISPPPSKRRKLSRSGESTSHSPPDRLPMFSHNVNGIGPYLQPSITTSLKPSQDSQSPGSAPKASLRDFLRRHDFPSMLFLQEVQINPDDQGTIRALEKAVVSEGADSGEPDYIARVCLSSDKYNVRGFGRKVYGVASIIREDFFDTYVGKVRPVIWDVEGRFLIIETKAVGPRPKLAIRNIYAVNGTELPYRDAASGAVS